jgi:hypothetical protein
VNADEILIAVGRRGEVARWRSVHQASDGIHESELIRARVSAPLETDVRVGLARRCVKCSEGWLFVLVTDAESLNIRSGSSVGTAEQCEKIYAFSCVI